MGKRVQSSTATAKMAVPFQEGKLLEGTLQELIDHLVSLKDLLGPNVKVLRADNSGGYEAIRVVVIEDAIETASKAPVKAVVLS